MRAHGVNPILNVSDLVASFDWFERAGWTKLWEFGEPPSFGAVGSGVVEIFLCHNAQGGRGRSGLTRTGGADGRDDAERGVWLSIWVDDVDAVHEHCLAQGLDVTYPPTDEPWGVREMHLRHPDGHVLRISQSHDHPHPHDADAPHPHPH